jgi:hypothetical protein
MSRYGITPPGNVHAGHDTEPPRGTVSRVNTETMLRLAEVDSLSADLQRRLWFSEDRLVRRALVKRDDLIDELGALAVMDHGLVSSWASVPRPGGALLSTAVSNAHDDHTIMELLRQRSLEPAHAQLLASRCGPVAGWNLVGRIADLLTEDVAAQLVRNYVASMEPRTDGPGRIFDEHLGERDALWAAAAEATTLGTLPVLRAVATRSVNRPGLQGTVVAALERLDGDGPVTDERTLRLLDGVSDSLLRCPWLPTDLVNRLCALRNLSTHSSVQLRRHLDLAGKLGLLDCDPSDTSRCDDEAHLSVLSALAALPHTGLLPPKVTLSALLHRDGLQRHELMRLLDTGRGAQSRPIAAQLEAAGRLEDLVMLVEQIGIPCVDELIDRTPVIVELARRGSRTVNDRNVTDVEAPEVVAVFRPLRDLLREPGLTSLVVERIEELDVVTRDVALGLLGEWEGSLPELIDAARSLAGS